MSRKKLRREIKKVHGGMAEVARRADVSISMVSKWLANKTDSAPVEVHVRKYVQELLIGGSNHAQS